MAGCSLLLWYFSFHLLISDSGFLLSRPIRIHIPGKGNENAVHQTTIQLRAYLCLKNPRDVHCRWQPSNHQSFQAKAWDVRVWSEERPELKAVKMARAHGVSFFQNGTVVQTSRGWRLLLYAQLQLLLVKPQWKGQPGGQTQLRNKATRTLPVEPVFNNICHMGTEKYWAYGILAYFSDLWGNFLSCKLGWDFNDPFEGHAV